MELFYPGLSKRMQEDVGPMKIKVDGRKFEFKFMIGSAADAILGEKHYSSIRRAWTYCGNSKRDYLFVYRGEDLIYVHPFQACLDAWGWDEDPDHEFIDEYAYWIRRILESQPTPRKKCSKLRFKFGGPSAFLSGRRFKTPETGFVGVNDPDCLFVWRNDDLWLVFDWARLVMDHMLLDVENLVVELDRWV